MEAQAKEILNFLLGTQKFGAFNRGVSLIQLVKIPLTKRVEAVYIQSNTPVKNNTVAAAGHKFPKLGASLYNVGLVVDHKTIYSEAIELRSLLDDTEEILPWAVCVYTVEESVQTVVLDKLAHRKLPELSPGQLAEAEKRAAQAAKSHCPPGISFGSLHSSYVLDDAIVDCLSNTQGWAERIAKAWLSKQSNTSAMLTELAIVQKTKMLLSNTP